MVLDTDIKYPPKVSINSAPNDTGLGASATTLLMVLRVFLMDGGKGYSDTNPPTVIIELPTKVDLNLLN